MLDQILDLVFLHFLCFHYYILDKQVDNCHKLGNFIYKLEYQYYK